jgi:hypothetical protein
VQREGMNRKRASGERGRAASEQNEDEKAVVSFATPASVTDLYCGQSPPSSFRLRTRRTAWKVTFIT